LRTSHRFVIKDLEKFKVQLLHWAQNFSEVIYLDSNNHDDFYHSFDVLLAVGAHSKLLSNDLGAFDQLEAYIRGLNDWAFGFFSYDLKNCTEDLHSENYDGLDFPELCFFQPKKLFIIKGGVLYCHYLPDYAETAASDFEKIKTLQINQQPLKSDPKIKLRIHKDAYFDKLDKLLEHIHRGDIYEANFCQEFYIEDTVIHPVETFHKLIGISKPPFSTFLKLDKHYLLSASPERFIKRVGKKIISQPIKGTARRSIDPAEDEALKHALENDEKERSENIMIVDLVRNDLSHTAAAGSVIVKELCKVYSFLQVHQMISTIESELREEFSGIEAIKQAFPMGSMTGAPKISAMRLIEELEETKRGLYSGSVGYFQPNGDFDFNVVIRSILYNAAVNYTSFSVGSAITAKSKPQLEYEECLLKARAMREVLENS
jgi:para-aminobenzoate synthetase component 1